MHPCKSAPSLGIRICSSQRYRDGRQEIPLGKWGWMLEVGIVIFSLEVEVHAGETMRNLHLCHHSVNI